MKNIKYSLGDPITKKILSYEFQWIGQIRNYDIYACKDCGILLRSPHIQKKLHNCKASKLDPYA